MRSRLACLVNASVSCRERSDPFTIDAGAGSLARCSKLRQKRMEEYLEATRPAIKATVARIVEMEPVTGVLAGTVRCRSGLFAVVKMCLHSCVWAWVPHRRKAAR
jgi:hypothetical protein